VNGVHGLITIDVDGVRVAFHCDHGADEASYRIEHDNANIGVYLSGTPEQLGAFADAIVRAVAKHVRDQFDACAREASR